MKVRLAKGLHASPRIRPAAPTGALDLPAIVRQAMHTSTFNRLFGEPTDVVTLVQSALARRGWSVPAAAIRETVEETS